MGNRFVNILLDQFRLTDEDDEYDDEEELREKASRKNRKTKEIENTEEFENQEAVEEEEPIRKTGFFKRENPPLRRYENMQEEKQLKTETAVPLHHISKVDSSVHVLKPRSFEEAKGICDTLRMGGVVFILFDDIDIGLAQRLMDFAGGSVYAMGGTIYQVSGFSFIVAPGDKKITGDMLRQIAGAGYEVPTLIQ